VKPSKYITWTDVTGYPTPKRGQNTNAQKTLATYFKPPVDQKGSRRKRNHACVILSNITALHVTTSHMHLSFQELRLWHGTTSQSQGKMWQNTELHSIKQEQLTRNSVMRLCSWKPGPNIYLIIFTCIACFHHLSYHLPVYTQLITYTFSFSNKRVYGPITTFLYNKLCTCLYLWMT
jgi:hypothetical protein